MLKTKVNRKNFPRRPTYLVAASLILLSGLAPLLYVRSAGAAQITTRSLDISSSQPGNAAQNPGTNVTYTFGDSTTGFEFGTSHIVNAMKLQACTTAVGTCTAPTGYSWASSGGYTLTNWQDTTAFVKDTSNQNDCDGTNNTILCIDRAASVAENTTSDHRIVITGVTNPSNTNCSGNPNCTFFIRMTTYTNATYTAGTITDTGTVASSTTQYLEVSAYVAEVLSFCIGTTAVDDATSAIAANCAAVSGTTVNIGVLDTALVNVSPVAASPYVGNGFNGVAMIRTNAINGAAVTYKAIQAGGGAVEQLGTLRTVGSTCSATETTYTDPCIRAQGITQAVFNPSADERFGMTVAGINCQSVQSYTCTFSAGTYNLVRDAQYDGDGTNNATNFDDDDQVTPPTTSGYAWDQTGTADTIASSTGSSTKVIDDEALILKFAAYSAITTPFGTYTARADFISIATY